MGWLRLCLTALGSWDEKHLQRDLYVYSGSFPRVWKPLFRAQYLEQMFSALESI